MVTLNRVGFLGRLGAGGLGAMYKPAFAPDMLTLALVYGTGSPSTAIRASTASTDAWSTTLAFAPNILDLNLIYGSGSPSTAIRASTATVEVTV